MGVFDRPEFRHHEMSIHMRETPGANGSQEVDPDEPRGQVDVDGHDKPPQQGRVFFIEQSTGSVANQAQARPHEMQADDRRNQRIEPLIAGQDHQTEADGHAQAGPEISQDMLTVGDQRRRPMAFASSDEKPTQSRVGEAGRQSDENPEIEFPDLDAEDQPLQRLLDDEQGGEGDQTALEGGGEELDLPVAVRVAAVGWPTGNDQCTKGDHGGHDVDDAFQSVRQNGGGSSQSVGEVLRAEQHQAHNQGQQSGAKSDSLRRIPANLLRRQPAQRHRPGGGRVERQAFCGARVSHGTTLSRVLDAGGRCSRDGRQRAFSPARRADGPEALIYQPAEARLVDQIEGRSLVGEKGQRSPAQLGDRLLCLGPREGAGTNDRRRHIDQETQLADSALFLLHGFAVHSAPLLYACSCGLLRSPTACYFSQDSHREAIEHVRFLAWRSPYWRLHGGLATEIMQIRHVSGRREGGCDISNENIRKKEGSFVEGLSVLDMVHRGAIATYPLIAFSVATVSIVFERLWALRNLVSGSLQLAGGICPSLERGQVGDALQTAQSQVGTPAGRIFSDVLARHSSDSLEYLADLTEEKRFEEVEALKGPLWVLGTVGASAPFIGLFGTVMGIIKAFHNMAVMGSGGFSVVAAGISEALVATGLGLGVAIIAVIFYNYFQTRVERIEAALTIASNRVLDSIHLGRQVHGTR